jgi:hypothetical protein
MGSVQQNCLVMNYHCYLYQKLTSNRLRPLPLQCLNSSPYYETSCMRTELALQGKFLILLPHFRFLTLTWIRAAEDVTIVALEKGSQVFPPIRIVLRVDLIPMIRKQPSISFACFTVGSRNISDRIYKFSSLPSSISRLFCGIKYSSLSNSNN